MNVVAQPWKVGVAIAVHNSAGVLGACLDALVGCPLHVVVFDDGSSDGTRDVARQHWPGVVIVQGDGTAWWGGGTHAAMERCYADGCEFAMMLNPDVRISGTGVRHLVERSAATGGIASALVVREGREDRLAWSGAVHRRHSRLLPIYVNRDKYPVGAPVERAGDAPYGTDEVHGRAVVVPREVYRRLGGLDAGRFPHYGADNDFSWRARAARVPMEIVPEVRARLLHEHSRMHLDASRAWRERFGSAWRYLFDRRHGEAARVVPLLYFRHLPPAAAICSTGAHLAAGVWQRLRAVRGEE